MIFNKRMNVSKYVSEFLRAESTESEKFAGLNILCCAAEGCKTQYETELENIFSSFVLPYLCDPNLSPKVKFAALTTCGQMCTDFGSVLVKRVFDNIVDAYSKALQVFLYF